MSPLITEDIKLKGDLAAERLKKLVEWVPPAYDENDDTRVKTQILTPGYRHYAFWGGRGGSKSHDAAEAIVELSSLNFERVVCGREFMNTIRDSSRSLLVVKIKESLWANDWDVTESELRNKKTGSLITFIGMNRNPDSARSLEGCTLFFGEEAESFSAHSLEVILPTIRTGGSRFVWLWNPMDGGPVDEMFRGGEPPERAFIRCVLGENNIYFYRTEMPGERRTAYTKLTPSKYRHIWRGALDTDPERQVIKSVRRGRIEVDHLDLVPHYGLDWGFSVDPFVCIEFFVIEPEDQEEERGVIYIDAEAYQVALPSREIPGFIDEKMPMARNHTIIADSAEPKSIEDLNNAGFHVIPARKGPGSIRAGVSLINSYDVVISPDCPNSFADFNAWMLKKNRQGVILRDPEDKDNHSPDALRYGLEDYTPPMDNDGVDWV